MQTPPVIQSVVGIAASAPKAIGAIVTGITGTVGQVWNTFHPLVPESLKKAAKLTKSAARIGGTCAVELLDFHGVKGTKNPLVSIEKSYERISEHDQDFAYCIHFIADEGSELIRDWLFGFASGPIVDWFKDLSKDLATKTIKANILHFVATLADQGFDSKYDFGDGKRNPLGRIISVIVNCLAGYEERLAKIAELPDAEQPEQYRIAFQEISTALLETCFPNGSTDIQLFHRYIPAMTVIKEQLWDKINKELPGLLERLYFETRPINELNKDWKEKFEDKAACLEADKMVKLPSSLIQRFIRDNKASLFDTFTPMLEKTLNEKQESEAEELSSLLTKYAKEFFLTEDPALFKMGAFFEQYFMERILFNLSQFVPDNADVPMTYYILKTWIEGNVFKMLSSVLSGAPLSMQEKITAITELCAPLGLDRQDSFPLPMLIKDGAWPTIESFLQDGLPATVSNLIPKWIALGSIKNNQKTLNAVLGHSSLVSSVSNMTEMMIDSFLKAAHTQFSVSQKLNELFPNVLTDDQITSIDEQYHELLDEKDSIDILKKFGQQCSEALVLQLCSDWYDNYNKSNEFVGVADLLGEPEIDHPPFAAWLFQSITDACEKLVFKKLNVDKLESLQRAIDLKNALLDPKDADQAKIDRAELDELWVEIQPMFDHLSSHLLGILDYSKASDLPLPDKLQATIWAMITTKLPHILFEQIGDLMLPMLVKQQLEYQLEDMPHGALIQQGCSDLANDLVQHLPNWLSDKLGAIPDQIIAAAPVLKMSDSDQDFLVTSLKAIVNKEDPAYEPFWQLIESYLEGMFLKIAVEVSRLSSKDLQKIRDLAYQANQELLELGQVIDDEDKEQRQKILVEFVDQLFNLLGIESAQKLFGIPQALQDLVFKLVKEKMAQGLLGISQLDHKVRHYEAVANPVESSLPTSEVAKATLALTRYALDMATDKLTKRVNGKVQVISQIYDSLNPQLMKLSGNGYKIAKLFQTIIKDNHLTPWLTNLFDLLDGKNAHIHKDDFANWLNPVLVDQLIYRLIPLLKKEEQGQEVFDQSLVMALIPVFTRHLKHLNEASKTADGLNFDNFIDVAGDDLHSAVVTQVDEKQGQDNQEKFYKEQAELIFQLIFPKGKEDVKGALEGIIDVSDQQWEDLSTFATENGALMLPKIVDMIFDKEMLTSVFGSLFETIVDSLDQPIKITVPKKKPPITAEEAERRREMNQQIGQLVVQVVQFMDLPTGFIEKLPENIKNLIGIKEIGEGVYESIGAALREKFDGEFFAKTIQQALANASNKKHVKSDAAENVQANKQASKQTQEEHLKELERKLAQKSLAYIFRYLGARIEHATDIFTNPILRFLRASILAIGSFVMVNLIGATLRLLKIERFVANRIYDFIQYRMDKTLSVLSQSNVHHNVVYHAVEAVEGVLMDEPAE